MHVTFGDQTFWDNFDNIHMPDLYCFSESFKMYFFTNKNIKIHVCIHIGLKEIKDF